MQACDKPTITPEIRPALDNGDRQATQTLAPDETQLAPDTAPIPSAAPFTTPAHAAPTNWEALDRERRNLPADAFPLVTSRACPPGCPSCHNSFGRSVRARSLESVLEEARKSLTSGQTHVVLLDEIFDHDAAQATRIAQGLAKLGVKRISLAHPLAGERMTPALAQALAAAGLTQCELHAGPPRRLQGLLGVHQDSRAFQAAARSLDAEGIQIQLRIFLGWPGEDAQDRRATFSLAMGLPWSHLRVQPASQSVQMPHLASALPTESPRRIRIGCLCIALIGNLHPKARLRHARQVIQKLKLRLMPPQVA